MPPRAACGFPSRLARCGPSELPRAHRGYVHRFHPWTTTGHPSTTTAIRRPRAIRRRPVLTRALSTATNITTCNCGTWTVVPFGTTLTTALGLSTERDPTSIGYPPSDPRCALSPSTDRAPSFTCNLHQDPVAWLIVDIQTTKRSDQRTIQSYSKCRQV